jgi:hypothetical protein
MNSPVTDLIQQIRRQEVSAWLSRDVTSIAHDLLEIGMAPAAVRVISKIMERQCAPPDPPRSWPPDMREMFDALPGPLQNYLSYRDAERNRALRMAMDEAAQLRKELKRLKAEQQPEATKQQAAKETDNGEEASK